MADADPLAMAGNCVRKVRALVTQLADPATTAASVQRGDDMSAAVLARIGASLATVSMAQDIRRVVDLLLADAPGSEEQ